MIFSLSSSLLLAPSSSPPGSSPAPAPVAEAAPPAAIAEAAASASPGRLRPQDGRLAPAGGARVGRAATPATHRLEHGRVL